MTTEATPSDVRPNAPILDVGEALAEPHVVARGLVETVCHAEAGDMRMVRGPIRFDGGRGAEQPLRRCSGSTPSRC